MTEIKCPHCKEKKPRIEKTIVSLGPGRLAAKGPYFEETYTTFFYYDCCGALICQVDPRLISGEPESP
jgi:hypothetical protein